MSSALALLGNAMIAHRTFQIWHYRKFECCKTFFDTSVFLNLRRNPPIFPRSGRPCHSSARILSFMKLSFGLPVQFCATRRGEAVRSSSQRLSVCVDICRYLSEWLDVFSPNFKLRQGRHEFSWTGWFEHPMIDWFWSSRTLQKDKVSGSLTMKSKQAQSACCVRLLMPIFRTSDVFRERMTDCSPGQKAKGGLTSLWLQDCTCDYSSIVRKVQGLWQ
jgi:hypothetical protein